MGLRRTLQRWLSPNHQARAYLRGLVNRRSGMKVAAGPFAGLRYVSESYGSAYIPKLVGMYECELNDAVSEALTAEHDRIIDVGAAEGYYAVGFAWRGDTPVVAYEMDAGARKLLAKVAEQNNVEDRITIRGECDTTLLEAELADTRHPFVLMDVEGAETDMLDLAAVPSLAKATILVEIHEFARPGVFAELLRRFGQTHAIEAIWENERTAKDFPYADFFTRMMPERYLRRAVDEQRGFKQSWLLLKPDASLARAAA